MYCLLSLFEPLSQLCTSLIESDMAAGGEVLIVDFELGNQGAIRGIFIRELLLALVQSHHPLVELTVLVMRHRPIYRCSGIFQPRYRNDYGH